MPSLRGVLSGPHSGGAPPGWQRGGASTGFPDRFADSNQHPDCYSDLRAAPGPRARLTAVSWGCLWVAFMGEKAGYGVCE